MTTRRRTTLLLPIGFALGLVLAAGCGDEDDSPNNPQPPTGQMPDFTLQDMNPNSASFGEMVSVRQEQGRISAWYFGAAT